MVNHPADESALVTHAQGGDGASFSALLNHYLHNIRKLTLNLTGNPDDAEDALQETCLKAYLKLEQFRGRSRFYTWLVRIAINEALMSNRNRRSERTFSLDEWVETKHKHLLPRVLADPTPNPEEHYARQELREALRDALQQLKPDYRAVVVLRNHYDTGQTASLLGLSVPAVKSRLQRARLRLRELLQVHAQDFSFSRPLRAALYRRSAASKS